MMLRHTSRWSHAPGNTLVPSHWQATRGSYLSPKYRRIAARRGPKKALVAIEHSILIIIWTMAHTGARYDDPGPSTTPAEPPNKRDNALQINCTDSATR